MMPEECRFCSTLVGGQILWSKDCVHVQHARLWNDISRTEYYAMCSISEAVCYAVMSSSA